MYYNSLVLLNSAQSTPERLSTSVSPGGSGSSPRPASTASPVSILCLNGSLQSV